VAAESASAPNGSPCEVIDPWPSSHLVPAGGGAPGSPLAFVQPPTLSCVVFPAAIAVGRCETTPTPKTSGGSTVRSLTFVRSCVTRTGLGLTIVTVRVRVMGEGVRPRPATVPAPNVAPRATVAAPIAATFLTPRYYVSRLSRSGGSMAPGSSWPPKYVLSVSVPMTNPVIDVPA
jgi:hypothetical protein